MFVGGAVSGMYDPLDISEYSMEELKYLDLIVTRARDAVVTILTKGISEAMNRFNDRRFTIAS